ncbi:MAG: hypothetical protein MUC77_20850, partial [Chromatiaceae bacterium]|nr:hypothetical protein [Chromatiaceae bacterium]
TMVAATVYDLYKNWDLLSLHDLPVFAVGFVAAFIAAILTVRALLRFQPLGSGSRGTARATTATRLRLVPREIQGHARFR